MNLLDLTFQGMYRIDGQELPLPPGLLVKNPPKKTARGREQDRLIVYLSLSGNVTYTASQYEEMVGQVAETFYNTPGSLTFALKSAVVTLNTFLVEENMKTTSKGLYGFGTLILCNLRGNSLYVVQAGSTHVFHFSDSTKHLFEPMLAGKGLGLSQNARMYFAQVILAPGDRLLMCADLPSSWEKSINDGRGSPSLDMMRRRLFAITDSNVNAVLAGASEGSGAMNIVEAGRDVASGAPAMVAPVRGRVDMMPVPPQAQAIMKEPERAVVAPAFTPAVPKEDKEVVAPVIAAPEPTPPPVIAPNEPAPVEPESPQPKKPSAFAGLRPALRALRDRVQAVLRPTALGLARSIQKTRAFFQKSFSWVDKVSSRLVPEHEDEAPFSFFTQAWGLFIVITIPVLLFIVSWITYHQLGYQAQFSNYYSRAQQAAEAALANQEPSEKRVSLQAALDWLEKAGHYQDNSTEEVAQLRQKVQSSLDEIDHVVRANYTIAFDPPLKSTMQVAHMAASETDIYLLDAANGNVVRGYLHSGAYRLDEEFVCGPGLYDGLQVDKLVDILVLPRSLSGNVTLLGIDYLGTIVYCTPGMPPRAMILPPSDMGWKNITAISYDSYNLYVLDSANRAVWVYLGNDTIQFTEKPYFFFENQVPVMMEEAVDMAVTNDDLYLLHKDGHLAFCIYSHILSSQTRCNDPALYVDVRPGYVGGTTLSDGKFTQVTLTGLNDPSLAFLEPYTQSIFRFSSGSLELQNQLRMASGSMDKLPVDAPITAMTFSPNRVLFLYVNGEVYYSTDVQ